MTKGRCLRWRVSSSTAVPDHLTPEGETILLKNKAHLVTVDMYVSFIKRFLFILVSFIPIIREIVGLATSIIAFTLASSLALVTIAVGWLRYRPLLAATIFIAAMVPVYLSRRKAEKDKTERKQ